MLSQLCESVVSKVKANCSLILDTIDSIPFVLVAIDILVVVQGLQDNRGPIHSHGPPDGRGIAENLHFDLHAWGLSQQTLLYKLHEALDEDEFRVKKCRIR